MSGAHLSLLSLLSKADSNHHFEILVASMLSHYSREASAKHGRACVREAPRCLCKSDRTQWGKHVVSRSSCTGRVHWPRSPQRQQLLRAIRYH
eukprot:862030-Amphidinium_carterae.1